MSSTQTTQATPGVDLDALEAATTVEEVLASSTVTWASTDNHGARSDRSETRSP